MENNFSFVSVFFPEESELEITLHQCLFSRCFLGSGLLGGFLFHCRFGSGSFLYGNLGSGSFLHGNFGSGSFLYGNLGSGSFL
jgi:hypothetical protein